MRQRTTLSRLLTLVAGLVATVVLASACAPAESNDAVSSQVDGLPNPAVPSQTTAVASNSFMATASDTDVEKAVAVFIDSSTTATATALVETIADNRNERWVPWLIDLLRINVSMQVSALIATTLEAITGVESQARIADMIGYGSWSQTRQLDGGHGYVDFKATLYERIDPEFGP